MNPFGVWAGSWIYVADAVFLGAVIAWLIAIRRGEAQLRRGWFYLPLVLYFGVMLVSTAHSSDPGQSARALLIEAYVLALAVFSFNQANSIMAMRRIAHAWILGGVITGVVAVIGVVLFYAGVRDPRTNIALGGFGSLPPGNYPRVTGLFLNFNMACNYLSVAVLLALAIRKANWLAVNRFRILAMVIGVAAVFTFSPGLGGIWLSAGLWMWVSWRELRPHRGWAAMVLGCGGAVAMFLATMISPVNTGERGVIVRVINHRLEPSSRLLCWEAALATIRVHPVLGEGPGLPMPCPSYLDPSGNVQHLQDAHNVFLNVAAHKGLLGLAAFLSIALYVLTRARPLRFDSHTTDLLRTAIAIAFIEGFLYQGLSSSFEHTRHLWILTGMVAGMGDRALFDG